MLDLVITGGEVVDGTGAPRERVDVGVKDGRIVAVGHVRDEAARTIDASGKVVSPGFIDVHTHYDAQAFWDGALTPSPLHGVTTVLAGNCGFTIAPLSEDGADGEYLMKMLARVEGMPLESLRDGVPWSAWRTTAEYLDAIDGRVGPNVGVMVGHSAIRRVVMGGDANQRAATQEEVEAMGRLLREGLEAGGIGFSSSWARTHNDADGRMVPSRYATRDELVELCRVTGGQEGTSLEFLPMVGPFEPWAKELMADMSVAAQRPLNWNILVVTAASIPGIENQLSASDVAREKGGKVVALTIPRPPGVRLSFASGFVLDAMTGWETVMGLPRAYKRAILADPVARAQLNAAAQTEANPMRGVADWSTKRIFDVVSEQNKHYEGRMLRDIAAEEGRDPFDVLCDIAVADDLLTSFGTDDPTSTEEEWKARLEVWRDGRAVIGASDAGAHLDLLATFNYSTVLLGEAVRARGLLPLEEAVHMITQVPAELYGLVDRGLVAEGHHADLVVFDPAQIGTDPTGMRTDLPGGAGRLYADAHGIDHVLVNGEALVADGRLTEERPGTVLRSGRDTRNPSMS
jgi:N-acyl-D-aspartate/D-glutamate deacylase